MISAHETALAALTNPALKTMFQDERLDVRPAKDSQIPILKAWLTELNCAVACDPRAWEIIESNWLSFLAATSEHPSTILAPNGKRVRFAIGIEPEERAKVRFANDKLQRNSVIGAVWRHLDSTGALVDRWPHESRLMMNRVVDRNSDIPFTSLTDDVGKQRRFNSVWSSMICFLLYCYEENDAIERMGLHQSEDLEEDLLDIAQALSMEGYPRSGDDMKKGLVEEQIDGCLMRWLIDLDATPKTNPLLWWTVILVRSSIETGPADFISRGHFSGNILPMDLDIQQRIEAILHFAKALLLRSAIRIWEPGSEAQILEVQSALNSADNTQIDGRKYDSPAWKGVLMYVEEIVSKFLVKLSGTPMEQITWLRKELPKE